MLNWIEWKGDSRGECFSMDTAGGTLKKRSEFHLADAVDFLGTLRMVYEKAGTILYLYDTSLLVDSHTITLLLSSLFLGV